MCEKSMLINVATRGRSIVFPEPPTEVSNRAWTQVAWLADFHTVIRLHLVSHEYTLLQTREGPTRDVDCPWSTRPIVKFVLAQDATSARCGSGCQPHTRTVHKRRQTSLNFPPTLLSTPICCADPPPSSALPPAFVLLSRFRFCTTHTYPTLPRYISTFLHDVDHLLRSPRRSRPGGPRRAVDCKRARWTAHPYLQASARCLRQWNRQPGRSGPDGRVHGSVRLVYRILHHV